MCSRTTLSPENKDRISDLLTQSLDWDSIKNLASRNGVLPLVSWNLLNNFAHLLSPEDNDELSLYLQKHTQNNLFSSLKLVEFVRTLEKAGIAVLPFKGVTLAKIAYDNLALRQFVDLDVLVKPKDFDKTVNFLIKSGYAPIGNPGGLTKRKSLFLRFKKDLGLVSPDGNVRIELHWKLSGSHFALPFEIDQLWGRLETVDLGGAELKALPFYDLFVYLCLHGSRHRWEKFSWICDLHELILVKENSGEKFDWEAVYHHAHKYGCEKVVELGLFLVQYFYDLKIDYPGYEDIINDETLHKIAQRVQKNDFSKNVNSANIGDWYLYHLTLKERKTDRMKLHFYYIIWYLKLAFRPNTLDKQVFHLPPLFYPLYYILRPFRLVITRFMPNSKKKTSDR